CFGGSDASCNVMDFGAAFLKAWESSCGAEETPTLLIPPNYVFLLSALILKGPCKATTILIKLEGKIVSPKKYSWVGNNKNSLITIIKVDRLTVDGTEGLIDEFGSSWWSCKSCPRPSILTFQYCNNLTVHDFTNSPKSHIHLHGCEDATFSRINVTAPADSPNNDGIDVSFSKNILIQDSSMQTGDDCIAISGGSSSVNVTGIACGPGHGISIGSLGKRNDTVEGIHVRNCSLTKTKYGARIKTFPNEEVEVSGVTFRGFQGTSFDGKAITLDCGESGCYNIVLDQIDIVSSLPAKPACCSCNNAHGTVTSTVPNCSSLLS
ncbi:hypothetical protein V8G54_009262, partial [Vigna mungo]